MDPVPPVDFVSEPSSSAASMMGSKAFSRKSNNDGRTIISLDIDCIKTSAFKSAIFICCLLTLELLRNDEFSTISESNDSLDVLSTMLVDK